MIVLDTHVLVWLDVGGAELGRKARSRLEAAQRGREVAVSAVSFWECAFLMQRGRLDLRRPPAVWREELLRNGLIELPLDGAAAMRAAELTGLPKDPADRFIVATAMAHDAAFMTADEKLLRTAPVRERIDARV